MTQHLELKHGDILHAGFTAPLQELLSAAVVNFRLVRVNSSTIAVPASAGGGQVGIAVGGKYDVAVGIQKLSGTPAAQTTHWWISGKTKTGVNVTLENATGTTMEFGIYGIATHR